MAESITIDPRFNGPPGSANGGYTSGRLAAFVEGLDAEVSLMRPPPLGRALAVERDGDGGAVLRDGEDEIAVARPVELEIDVPSPGDVSNAAASAFADPADHPFPTCFGCGPAREPGDGLRVLPGPLPGSDLFAAAFTPHPKLADAHGTLPPELVWASLDCPTSAPVANDPADPDFRPIVLGRLAVRILGRVHAGREHTIVSWPIEVDGRKRTAGAALHTADGELLAVSRALWIELKPAAS